MWPPPARRRGVEILDDPAIAAEIRLRAMADVARANSLFGGRRAAIQALRGLLSVVPRRATLLDVGTGVGDIPAAAAKVANSAGIAFDVIGVDVSLDVLRAARTRIGVAVAGDATRLPLSDGSIDVVTCSQLLHHFVEEDASTVIAELHRVSRGWVIVSDLRRSWIAAAGFWAASFALRFHPVARRDGVISVFRGFTPIELEQLVLKATGVRPRMRRGMFWRLSATWRARGD